LKITDKEVRYVANLANLALTEEEVARMVHDLGGILEHMDRLAEINTEGVAPMAQVLYPAGETATLRPDVERAPLGAEIAVANAPLAGQGYFKVPKVIER
jgi:aspartyl-tRNA(Asn)/glutamyl-tRNA(Gln) amidotransferase subunit C